MLECANVCDPDVFNLAWASSDGQTFVYNIGLLLAGDVWNPELVKENIRTHISAAQIQRALNTVANIQDEHAPELLSILNELRLSKQLENIVIYGDLNQLKNFVANNRDTMKSEDVTHVRDILRCELDGALESAIGTDAYSAYWDKLDYLDDVLKNVFKVKDLFEEEEEAAEV